ncbi:MAG: hypothetical protein GY715_12850 [Planctomycetes bacterium]|nr:hypothetical protein [Planctomycetota bacterium]
MAGLIAAVSLHTAAHAQCYEIGTVEQPEDRIQLLAMNENGLTVGFRDNWPNPTDTPVVWSLDLGLVPIEVADSGKAQGVNDLGYVAGVTVYPARAFLYYDGDTVDLGVVPGGNVSNARAINNAQQIVGSSGDSVLGPIHAFLWQDGVMTSLAAQLDTCCSTANDINGQGVITGYRSIQFPNDKRAFILDGTSLTTLEPVPGGVNSEGTLIDDAGNVVGWGQRIESGEARFRSFRWDGEQMVDLGILPEMTVTVAYGMNNHAVVVGACLGPSPYPRAFVWERGVIRDLNDLMPADTPITLTRARDVNDQGIIISWARAPGVPSHSVVLTPVAPPPADLTEDCRTGFADLLALPAAWGTTDSAADYNDDGVVDAVDLVFLLSHWG